MPYTDISPKFKAEFFKLINAANRVIITGHINPDEDAVASVLATYEIIKLGYPDKVVHAVLTGDPINRLRSFKNFNKIEFVEDIADIVEVGDALVVLDGSQLYRFSRQPEKLAALNTKICIDHHASPVDDFTLSLVAPKYPAATEIVYRALLGNTKVSKELAEVFLLGILSDTGTLAYIKPNQLETLTLVKDLLAIAQVEVQEFLARYETISQREFAVFMEFCKNTRFGSTPGWPNFQYSFLTESFVGQGSYSDIELTTGSVQYKNSFLRKVQGHPWGFMIKPTPKGVVSISCRALPGSVNVRDMMERMQLGGGHNRAAGGEVKNGDAQKTVELILGWISKNKPSLG